MTATIVLPSAGLVLGALVLGSSLRQFRTPPWLRQVALAMLIANAIAVGGCLAIYIGLLPVLRFLPPLCHALTAAMILTALYIMTRCAPMDRR